MSNSKRRALSLVLVIAIIMSMFTMATTSVSALKYGNFPLGDADLDGQVGIRDATLVQMYITRQATMDEQQLRLADVNEYPDIQISDATFIQMKVAKMVADYPKNSEGLVIGKDTITYEEPTTAPETTEPTTEPTTAPVTEPTTEPTTAPETTEPTEETTEPTTAPETTKPTTEPTTAPETTEPTTAPVSYDYYVAGDEALTGFAWSPDAAENGMTKNADGTYSITYKAVPAGTYSFKVTDGTWENSWGVNGQNYGFTLNKESDVTITFNPTTTEITVKADGLGTFTLDYITAVGNGSGSWLNGENWVVDSEANKMTETENGVWTITYTDIPAGDDYQVKFACNGNWAYNWNADGHFDGQINTPQVVDVDHATVTLVIDVNGFDFATKEGTVEIKFIVEEPETLPQTTAPTTEPTTAPETDPTTEPTTAPVTDPTTEPTTAPVTDPTTEPTTAPETDPTTEPTTAPSDKQVITVGVIKYVYSETSDDLASYELHYWGDDVKSGDAVCTPLNTTEEKSVGSSYWSGEAKTFHMFTAEIPAEATGYKFHIGDRWFGDDGDTTKSNAVYVFNYSGDKALYTTVTPVEPTEPTTEPTEATTEPTTAPETDPTTEPTTAPETTEPTTAPVSYDYYVAGDEALTGFAWSPDASENGMTKNADGTYSITYKAVPAGTYSFKVTDGTWENSWGVNGQNYGFTLNKASDVTITFNPTTTEITVKADGLGTFTLDYITAVGNGAGNWLNGENWVVDSETNKMTETEKGVWTITYTDIPAGDDYQVKFACNGNWAYNWNADGHFDGQINTPQVVEKDGSTVTLVIDVNGFDFATKEGTVEIKFIVEEPETLPQTTAPTTEPTTAPETDPTTEPTTAPVTDPTTEPTTAPETDPTTEPTTAPETDPTTEPTTAPETDPTTEPTTAPVTDPTTEPTTAPETDPTTEPTTAPSNTKTITVGVINYVYDETSDKLDSYQVHYWGDDVETGDAVCTPLNTTEKKSVGSSYWSGAEQTFYMFTAEIPADATGYKFHIGDRWFGDDGDTAKTNAVYAFNYSGDKALYATVTPVNPTEPTEETTEPTTAPETTDPTTEPTTAPETTEPTTAPSNTKTITVGVINYVYDETSSKVSTYQVHYWGGAETGDATCTPLNTTEKKSVGSSYWSNAAQTFQMFTVEIPKDATGFKFHIGDRWFGADGDATKQDTVYIFNYSGDKALYE